MLVLLLLLTTFAAAAAACKCQPPQLAAVHRRVWL